MLAHASTLSRRGDPQSTLWIDAVYTRRVAEFKAADDRRRNATARTAELEAAIDRLGSRIRKAEEKEAKKAAATARAFNRVMNTRAKSLEGLLAKVKVRRRWNIDDEASELQILKSLVADIKAMS